MQQHETPTWSRDGPKTPNLGPRWAQDPQLRAKTVKQSQHDQLGSKSKSPDLQKILKTYENQLFLMLLLWLACGSNPHSHPENRRASQWANNSPGSQSTILSFRKPTINQPFGQLCCEIDDKTTHQQTRRWSKQVMNQRSGAMMKPTEVPLAHDQEIFCQRADIL